MASKYHGRCGDNWVTEGAEIGVPPPGDTGRQNTPCSQMLKRTRHEESQTEGSGAKRENIHQVNISKGTLLSSFVFTGKILGDF
jgi:hypothetical protein